MDFAALQQKLFDLDPSDRAEDLRRLTESVGGAAQESVQTEENFLQESVEIAEGTMPVEGDYSLSDFAALAGVTLNESQKTGSAGQLKGKDPMPKAKARGKHPHVDKLVGEAKDDGAWDVMKKTYAKGKKDYNKLGALDPFDKAGTAKKAIDNTLGGTPVNSKAPRMDANNWKGFLKQHTTGLQAIANDPKKKAAFDKFMSRASEGIEEAPKPKMPKTRNPVASHAQSSGSGVHADQNKKKQPMRKDKHKKQLDFATESIKEMLYRKLNAKK